MAQTRTIARPYAAAIFDLAAREQAFEAWSDELALVVRLTRHETIVRLLEDSVARRRGQGAQAIGPHGERRQRRNRCIVSGWVS